MGETPLGAPIIAGKRDHRTAVGMEIDDLGFEFTATDQRKTRFDRARALLRAGHRRHQRRPLDGSEDTGSHADLVGAQPRHGRAIDQADLALVGDGDDALADGGEHRFDALVGRRMLGPPARRKAEDRQAQAIAVGVAHLPDGTRHGVDPAAAERHGQSAHLIEGLKMARQHQMQHH